MSLILNTFPVRIPSGGIPPTLVRGGSLEIRFYDDFDDVRQGGTHNAQDIKGPIGLHVVSTTNGTVVRQFRIGANNLPGVNDVETSKSGFYVAIVDIAGFFHHYAHLRERARVGIGDKVSPGQVIGFLGQTGNARGSVPHLHYQVRTPLPDRPEYETLVFSGQGVTAVRIWGRLRTLAVADGWAQQRSSPRYTKLIS